MPPNVNLAPTNCLYNDVHYSVNRIVTKLNGTLFFLEEVDLVIATQATVGPRIIFSGVWYATIFLKSISFESSTYAGYINDTKVNGRQVKQWLQKIEKQSDLIKE